MLVVITSFDEKFNEGAERIKLESEFWEIPCKIIALSDKINDCSFICDISNKDFVYFLTNNMSVIKFYLPYFLSKGCFIANKEFFRNPKSKLEAQNIIKKIGVFIPKNFIFNQIKEHVIFKEKMSYPLFIKNKNHCMPITKIQNENNLISHFKNLKKPNEWYIEENMASQYRNLQKLYFTFGKITPRNIVQKIPRQITNALRDISKVLKLDSFSADFIIEESSRGYWCIDINPASAFFLCDKARKNFLEYVKRTIFLKNL